MYNLNRTYVYKFLKTKCFIAPKLDPIKDEFGNEIPQYGIAKKYMFNIQPVTTESEIREFGELAPRLKVATITERIKYENKFNEFDLAYLDGATPEGETFNGENANYRIYAVQKQNMIIKLYFLKEVK